MAYTPEILINTSEKVRFCPSNAFDWTCVDRNWTSITPLNFFFLCIIRTPLWRVVSSCEWWLFWGFLQYRLWNPLLLHLQRGIRTEQPSLEMRLASKHRTGLLGRGHTCLWRSLNIYTCIYLCIIMCVCVCVCVCVSWREYLKKSKIDYVPDYTVDSWLVYTANSTIEIIPPVTAHLWTQIMWLVFMRVAVNLMITCSLAFIPHELFVRD